MWSLVFLAVLVGAQAFNFDVSVFPGERRIKLNESAMFEVEISHDSALEEVFEAFSSDVTWDIRSQQVMRVPAGKKFKTNLSIRPLNLNPGAYNLPVTFKRSGSAESERVVVYIEVLSPFSDESNYLPAVRGVASIDPVVDPRKGVVLKLSLENQNRRILDKVDVKVRSRIVNKDYTTSLGALEKKTLTFIAEIDAKTPPHKDALQISVVVPDQDKAYQFDVMPVAYEVAPYGGIVPQVSIESAFLKHTDRVLLVNEANRKLTHTYRVPAWFAKRWFIVTNPEAVVESGDLTWEVMLESGEMAELVLLYNYRPLFWVLLIVAVIIGAYLVFRSPLYVQKRAKIVATHEGGITELKVVIELINRSSKPARSIKVLDLVPHLASVVEEFKDTVLAPSKITPHENRGTLVRWDIDMMDAKEHRILMYRIKTKMGVLGGLSLPVAAAHFVFEGHERETASNKPEVRA